MVGCTYCSRVGSFARIGNERTTVIMDLRAWRWAPNLWGMKNDPQAKTVLNSEWFLRKEIKPASLSACRKPALPLKASSNSKGDYGKAAGVAYFIVQPACFNLFSLTNTIESVEISRRIGSAEQRRCSFLLY